MGIIVIGGGIVSAVRELEHYPCIAVRKAGRQCGLERLAAVGISIMLHAELRGKSRHSLSIAR